MRASHCVLYPIWSVFKIQSGSATYVGQRTINEDHVLVRADLDLYVLADGAGGKDAGDVASRLATKCIAEKIESTHASRHANGAPDVDAFGLFVDARRLVSAIQKANKDVLAAAKDASDKQGMGTTVVAVVPAPRSGAIHVAHVGDSRCYRLRDGRLEQLTQDHSLLHDVLESWPDLDDAALAKLPRNVVTRALGMGDALRVSIATFEMVGGDRYLLCSDGLTDSVEEARIGEILADRSKGPPAIARALVEAAKQASARDNVAVVVLGCEGQLAKPFRAAQSTILPPKDDAPRRREGSDPEIVILGIAEGPQPNGPEPMVVPRGSSDRPPGSGRPAWREALDELIAPTKTSTNKPPV